MQTADVSGAYNPSVDARFAHNGTSLHPNDRHGYAFANVPQALKDIPQWGVWLPEYQNGKLQRVPYDAKTGKNLSVSDPATWSTFEETLSAYLRGTRGQWGGLSVVLKEGGSVVGLDVDDCVDEYGDLTPEAQALVHLWDSYLEYSPSRRSIRGFAYGTLPEGRRHVGNFEIYDTGKALTVTGWRLHAAPTTIAERTLAIAEIHKKFFTPAKQQQYATGTGNADAYEPLSDEEVIEKAVRAKNGDRIRALIDGDLSGYASTSEADLAACNFLAFYCGPNSHDQIDRIFRARFAFFRPQKWDKRHYHSGQTYGEHTVQVALEGRSMFYTRPALRLAARIHRAVQERHQQRQTQAHALLQRYQQQWHQRRAREGRS